MSTDTVHEIDWQTDDDDAHADHPSDAQYVKIAIFLAILTALEVATYFFEDSFNWGPILVLMMFVKGVVVAGYFMHLKFDNRLLTRIFVAGFVLACVVYIMALSAFRFWENSGMRDDYGVNARATPFVLDETDGTEMSEEAGDDGHGEEGDHGDEGDHSDDE